MINNQFPSNLYNCLNRSTLFLVILCFSLISCATTKQNSQDEIKQVHSEPKPLVEHEKNKTSGGKIEQSNTSSSANNRPQKTLPQSIQQKTNAGNYSSEIQNTQTSEENVTQLEDKLDASLSDFDEMLLKKNEQLSEQSLGKQGQIGDGLESQTGNGTERQEQGQGQAESKQQDTSSGNSTARSGAGQSNTGTMSQDKDFNNDDVVARQIREAAEKETDPELKKKLWEEYRKYKAGSN